MSDPHRSASSRPCCKSPGTLLPSPPLIPCHCCLRPSSVKSKRNSPGPVTGQAQNPCPGARRQAAESTWCNLGPRSRCPRRGAAPHPIQGSALKLPLARKQRPLSTPSTGVFPKSPPLCTGSPMALHNPEPQAYRCTSLAKAGQMCLEQSSRQGYLVH